MDDSSLDVAEGNICIRGVAAVDITSSTEVTSAGGSVPSPGAGTDTSVTQVLIRKKEGQILPLTRVNYKGRKKHLSTSQEN